MDFVCYERRRRVPSPWLRCKTRWILMALAQNTCGNGNESGTLQILPSMGATSVKRFSEITLKNLSITRTNYLQVLNFLRIIGECRWLWDHKRMVPGLKPVSRRGGVVLFGQKSEIQMHPRLHHGDSLRITRWTLLPMPPESQTMRFITNNYGSMSASNSGRILMHCLVFKGICSDSSISPPSRDAIPGWSQ